MKGKTITYGAIAEATVITEELEFGVIRIIRLEGDDHGTLITFNPITEMEDVRHTFVDAHGHVSKYTTMQSGDNDTHDVHLVIGLIVAEWLTDVAESNGATAKQ